MVELKPCPVCGGEPEAYGDKGFSLETGKEAWRYYIVSRAAQLWFPAKRKRKLPNIGTGGLTMAESVKKKIRVKMKS